MSATANSTGGRNVENVLHGYGNLATLEQTPPLTITGGRGIYIFDEDGGEYIEGAAGMWCASFGFSEPALIEAAVEQFHKLPYYHGLIDKTMLPMGKLAERLKSIAPGPMSKVFFANSGSEANDTLIKLIWYYNNSRGRPEKKKLIARDQAFHGLTVAAGSLTGIAEMHADFDLPIDRFLHTDCPHFYRYGHPGESEEDYATRLAANLEKLILDEGPETIAAFFAEPVMGSGGCLIPPRTYFEKVQAVLRRYDILMVADEVICGFGRTGEMFGCDTYGIRPDAMALAKGLSGAYQPISAVMISEDLYQGLLDESRKLGFFAHASTTTGHPVAAAVALRCQELMEERDILGHVRSVSPGFSQGLADLAEHPLIGDVRSVGLMGAVELVADKDSRRRFAKQTKVKDFVRARAQEHGLIVRTSLSSDSLAFSPPLIISREEIEEMLTRFRVALDEAATWVDDNDLRAVQ